MERAPHLLGPGHGHVEEGRHQGAREQQRAADGAGVHLVPELERAVRDRLQRHAAAALDRLADGRRQDLLDEAQLLGDLGPVEAEAEPALRVSLEEAAVAARARGAVLDHQHGHRRRVDSGVHTHAAVLLGRAEDDSPRSSWRRASSAVRPGPRRLRPTGARCDGPRVTGPHSGAPLVRMTLGAIPGTTSRAFATPTRPDLPRSPARARWFASARFTGSCHHAARRACKSAAPRRLRNDAAGRLPQRRRCRYDVWSQLTPQRLLHLYWCESSRMKTGRNPAAALAMVAGAGLLSPWRIRARAACGGHGRASIGRIGQSSPSRPSQRPSAPARFQIPRSRGGACPEHRLGDRPDAQGFRCSAPARLARGRSGCARNHTNRQHGQPERPSSISHGRKTGRCGRGRGGGSIGYNAARSRFDRLEAAGDAESPFRKHRAMSEGPTTL